ncbi:mediator of RNA polymerase II transcription subunit 33B-like isoform X1 [Salvia splendens]|uniref:mediator of RNA polymerase II transcription subunit 33B-like isoform X1 n=1 Tax=Salvia splendens TaxID=180675 RepID=UPI001C276076|nr:mediator of RNA polymerase II transcription subunit 33B-like isoform X1 [Salvia splendens]
MAAAAGDDEETAKQRLWDGVLELTKAAQVSGTDPLMWTMQLSATLTSAGVSMPSVELADLLVSHICWSNNHPIAWKFLEKALTIRIVPPMLVLALLSTRVIPSRRRYPVAYRLYMELLKRYAFSLLSLINGRNYHKIMESINDVLQFYQIFGVQFSEPGILVVIFVFSVVWELLDASLDDEGLLEFTAEKKSRWPVRSQDMDIDYLDNFDGKRMEHQEALSKINSIMAVELLGEFFRDKTTSRILYLARRNMPVHWECFIDHLRLLAAKSGSLRNSKNISPEALLQLTSAARQVLSPKCKTNSQKQLHAVTAISPMSSASQCLATVRSELWLPIDLYLEDTMDGSQVRATSAVEALTGLVKGLQALNETTWQEAFLGLWTAALRLVQRERNSSEGPVPRIDTCLCMLLSIAILAVVNIIEEDEIMLNGEAEQCSVSQRKNIEQVGKRHQDLISSLQQLDDFEGLLTAPPPVSSLANQAAAKAMFFLSGMSVGSGHLSGMSLNDIPLNCTGNLRHLIVEACIARNVLDTSAYMWPGYVKGRCSPIPRNISGQVPGWSSFMKGSPLTPPMISALVSTPATSLAELERLYEIAVSGTDDEKISAATIFCGASLTRGWSIQEHTGLLITRLLSPAFPTDFSGSESHLIGSAPFLNVILVGVSSIDCVQIFSSHGLVPQLAAALMPICEVFGSYAPTMSWSLNTGEEISSHVVFSNAFTLLLKLWRFDQPPMEHIKGDVTPVGSHLTPDYLLLVHNSQLASYEDSPKNQNKTNKPSRLSYTSPKGPIFMDSFPKLKRWYRKHQECIVSILSGLKPGNPVHGIVEALLNMMFRKINRGQTLASTTSGSSASSASGPDDYSLRLKLPAWDILEAVPFVLDAALTACAHGRLSPREYTTGLKDLADFLPASLATIVSYFSAEVTRGLWKPACMNGTDWPSPAANLAMVEQLIHKILAATGVDVPDLSDGGSSMLTLPLPLAAMVSLTITYKLDRGSERLLNLIGPALSSLGISCPWPCMPIISSLWIQKIKRWSDFLVFSASQTVFHHNHDAIVQLLRVCFAAALGSNSSSVASKGGVGALLGHGFGSNFSGGLSAVAPGILYLRVHRAVRNIMFMIEEIVSLLMNTVKDIANSGLPPEKMEKLKKTKFGMKYGQVSLSAAMSQVKLAASLGASLVCLTGGLSSVQAVFNEILPSWFLSLHGSYPNRQDSGGMGAMLAGYALAYFTVYSGMFAWGADSASVASKRRPKVLQKYLEFVASAIDGKISLGCNKATWRAYVTRYLSLMVSCTPAWMLEVDVEVIKRVSKGLKQWNEEELALALLGISGIGAMGAAAEMIVETGLNFCR